MMMDHTIAKPARTAAYSLHRMVAALVDGAPALFVDNGDHIVVRTAKTITATGRPLAALDAGAVIGFELKACVAARQGNRNIYPALHDWRSRREWLEAQGLKHGFELMAVHVNGERETVATGSGRTFQHYFCICNHFRWVSHIGRNQHQ